MEFSDINQHLKSGGPYKNDITNLRDFLRRPTTVAKDGDGKLDKCLEPLCKILGVESVRT